MKKDKIEFKVIQKSRVDILKEQALTRGEEMSIYGGEPPCSIVHNECTNQCVVHFTFTCPPDTPCPLPFGPPIVICIEDGLPACPQDCPLDVLL